MAKPTTNLPRRKQLPHEVPNWVKGYPVYFITVNCKQRGGNSLCHREPAQGLKDTFHHRIQQGQWWPRLTVLMPDHLHMLLTFGFSTSICETIRSWKRFASRKLGLQWQRDFFEHRIRNDAELMEKEACVRENPVRAGLVSTAEDWEYAWGTKDFMET